MFSDLPLTIQEAITNLLHDGDFVGAKIIYDEYCEQIKGRSKDGWVV